MAAARPLNEARGTDEVGEQLTSWGKVVRVETRGRVTGRTSAVAIGFLQEPDGSLLVAAGEPDSDWALNLAADPLARVTVEDESYTALAEPLDPEQAAHAVTGLILKYGTPAERLGRGPAFRLRRLVTA